MVLRSMNLPFYNLSSPDFRRATANPLIFPFRAILQTAFAWILIAASVSAQDLYVGSNSSEVNTSFTFGTNTYNNTYVGYLAGDSNNILQVSDPIGFSGQSVLTNSQNSYVGFEGSANSLVVTNRGITLDANGYVGYETNSSNNSVIIQSVWSNTSTLSIGSGGNSNNMQITLGGYVSDSNGIVGDAITSSNNSALISFSNSVWVNTASLIIGNNGSSNSLSIIAGGYFVASTLIVGKSGSGNSVMISNTGIMAPNYISQSTDAYVGYAAGSSNNSILINGTVWQNGNSLTIGSSGSSNTLLITNESRVNEQLAYVGGASGSKDNTVLVTGGSVWNNTASTWIGGSGSSNRLIITNEGSVSDTDGVIGNATNSSNNSALVNGQRSSWKNTSSLTVGNGGSGNSMIISNGGNVTDNNGYIGGATNSSNNSVLVTGAGSQWSNSALYIGLLGSATLTVANGGNLTARTIYIADQPATYGTLNIGYYGRTDSAGTMQASSITFGNGTGGINFNQTDSFALTTSISGTGRLNQLGTGTTILSGDNSSLNGQVTISSGTLLVNNTGRSATGSGTVIVSSGGTLGGSGILGGNVIVSGNLTPGIGGSRGFFSINGNLTFDTNAETTLTLNSAPPTPGLSGTNYDTNYDSINVSGNITYNGTLELLDNSPAPGIFNIFGVSSTSSNFQQVALAGSWFRLNAGIWSYSNGTYDWIFTPTSGKLTVTLVPEPYTWDLLGIAIIFGWITKRKCFQQSLAQK